jgi:hypothetical protein
MARPRYTNTKTQEHQEASLFDQRPTTPAVGSREFLSESGLIQDWINRWDETKALGIKPLHASDSDGTEQLRAEFLQGAQALGVIGRGLELKPQQLLVGDILNSPMRYFGVLMPRRSTKTTSILATALGRCLTRPGYKVAYTMCTAGVLARKMFREEIANKLDLVFPDFDSRPFKILRGGGSERIEFANGSLLVILPPIGANFRGGSYDLIILDEAGEASVEMTEDVLAGALPTMDTRPGAQLIVAGTAGEFRQGNLLWDYLERGREKVKGQRYGILEFAALDSTSEEDLKSWEIVEQLVLAAHPGVAEGNLTELQTVRERWEKYPPERFSREYLSIFGTGSATSGIVNMAQWYAHAQKGELGDLETMLPKVFAAAFHVHPEQTCSTIVAAWRDEDGHAKGLVLDRPSVPALAKRVKLFAQKYPRVPIAHDTNGPVTVEAETIGRMRPKIKLAPQTFPNIKTASALIIKEIEMGNFDHWDQPTLNEAARIAKKRSVGPTAWALGRVRAEDDIIDLEALAIALRQFDDGPRAAIMPRESAA